jgi:hypothetical protein
MINGERIKVVEIKDNEDGSATLTVDMSDEAYHFFFEHGFRQVLMSAIDKEVESGGD